MTHFQVSIAKSLVRCVGYAALGADMLAEALDFAAAASLVLLVAEMLGILEEAV